MTDEILVVAVGMAGDACHDSVVTDVLAQLDGGLVLRGADDGDRDQIVELSVAAHGEVERWGVTALVDDPTVGPPAWLVVVEGDRVVSTMCLLERTLRYGSVEIGLGQPEYVATAPTHRHRGLIRAQLDELHRRSAGRGDLAQLIVGIPYYYRRFGYEYALAMGALCGLRADRSLSTSRAVTVRRAELADLDPLRHVDDLAVAATPVRVPRSEAGWARMVAAGDDAPHQLLVAERDGALVGAADVEDWGGSSVAVVDLAAVDPDAAPALVDHVRRAHPDRGVQVLERPGTVAWSSLVDVVAPELRYAYYVRVGDPRALLDAVSSELSARLTRSHLGGTSGELVVSLYREGVRLVYEEGQILGVEACAPVQDPIDDGSVGIPPDLVATLVFGRHGARELERRHDDVTLGADRDLLEVLFPRLQSDVQLEV